MKPNEAMRALPIEDEAAYGQSDKRMCQLIIIRCTSHQSIDYCRAYPDFREQIVCIFIDGIVVNDIAVQSGNRHVNDEKQPQVAFGVALPVFT